MPPMTASVENRSGLAELWGGPMARVSSQGRDYTGTARQCRIPAGHGVYYYVPSLLEHFTTVQINALIASRLPLPTAGTQDKLTPVHGLDRLNAELKPVYAQAGAPTLWKLLRCDHGSWRTRNATGGH